MFKVKATRHEFARLIASCYKKTDLLRKIVETEMKVARDYQKAISQDIDKGQDQDKDKKDKKDKGQDQDKELVTTLRMTIVGFD
jgi:intergrase/recombinase